jgi:CHAT domain-containing protein/tetratricopeptide (TPR) repeat protein
MSDSKMLRLIPMRGGCWGFVERLSADTWAGLAALALRLSLSRDGCSWNRELNLSYGPTRDWLSARVFAGLLVNGLLVAAQLAGVAAVAAPNDESTTLNARAVELYNARNYIEATSLAERALAIREKSLGPNHASLAPILNNLAGLYEAQGRYADAEPLYKREIAIYEKTFGTDHPNFARALSGLAVLYTHQARYGDAERLYIRVLAIREKALGPKHPDVATSLNDLAELYYHQGRYPEGEPLLKRSLAIRENLLGPNSSEVAETLNDLASFYIQESRYAEAESIFQRALAIEEKALGLDHPDLASVLNNLSGLYYDEGRYAEAGPLLKRSLEIMEKALAPNHPNVAVALNNLADFYYTQGRYANAEPLFKRSLAIYETALGSDHPDVATVLNGLALLYSRQGRYADAEPLYRRSLAIREKALGFDHPDVAVLLGNLAQLYEDQGRYAEAEPLLKRSLAITEKALGSDNASFATALNNLAELYKDQGRYAEAEPLLRRSLAISEKARGSDHPDVAVSLNNIAKFYYEQGRFTDAEPLFKRSLAIYETALGSDHPDVATVLNNLAALYGSQHRYSQALPFIQTAISQKRAGTWAALPVLFGAQAEHIIPADQAMDESLNVVQRAFQTSAGEAMNALAARFSAGTSRLAGLVRKDQDLAGEATNLDKAIIAAVAKEPSRRDVPAEQKIRHRIDAIAHERDNLNKVFAREFPDFAALSRPEPLTAKELQLPLADDEALVIVDLDATRSHVWVITRSAADWKELAVTADEVSQRVSALRGQLGFDTGQPFNTQASFDLYRKILAPVENMLSGKSRLSFVVNGALTSLPPQVLITSDPKGRELILVDWLIRKYAVTMLPSVASLKVLRGKNTKNTVAAVRPLIGYGDPIFDRSTLHTSKHGGASFNQSLTSFYRGATADTAALAKALPALPETADELRAVANELGAKPDDIRLGEAATVTDVKQASLDIYRIVYFATHALVAGEVEKFARVKAEPALVLSIPSKPTEEDDGLLRASDVATLKMNADFVVLSACNTAAGDKPGAEALSGLARAFFYAGAKSLIVSNWEVDSVATVAVMTGLFNAVKKDPHLSHAEALRLSMLQMIDNPFKPDWARPKYWAPFIVVGEPQKD